MTLERIEELSGKVSKNELSEKDIKDLLQLLKKEAMEKQNQDSKVARDIRIFRGK